MKCQPLKCNRFKRLFDRFYDKALVDRFVLACPFRNGNECTNQKERLDKVLIK